MGVSVWGNTHPHLHSPCPRCGFATRFKQWPNRCACPESQRHPKGQASRGPGSRPKPESTTIQMHNTDFGRIPPLRIAARYASGRVPVGNALDRVPTTSRQGGRTAPSGPL